MRFSLEVKTADNFQVQVPDELVHSFRCYERLSGMEPSLDKPLSVLEGNCPDRIVPKSLFDVLPIDHDLGSNDHKQVVSPPYYLRILLSKGDKTKPLFSSKLVSGKATLTLDYGSTGEKRFFRGIILRSATRNSNLEGSSKLEICIYPDLWALSVSQKSRVWKNVRAGDVLSELQTEYLKEISDFASILDQRLGVVGRAREAAIQWNESDFEFVSRLLERDGEYYAFHHDEYKSEIILLSHKYPVLKNFLPTKRLPFVPYDKSQENFFLDAISACISEQKLTPKRYAVADYNPLNASIPLNYSSPIDVQSAFEVYDYPAEVETISNLEEISNRRLNAVKAREDVYMLSSKCPLISAGHLVSAQTMFDEYDFLDLRPTQVVHELVRDDNNVPHYINWFEAIDAGKQYSPSMRTPIPSIQGTHNAVVVTHNGLLADIDDKSRALVVFRWDREQIPVRVRLGQPWAGGQHGMSVLPRGGDEVIISFIQGNTERPIIITSLHNSKTGKKYDPTKTIPIGLQGTIPKPPDRTQQHTSAMHNDSGNALLFNDTLGKEVTKIDAYRDFILEIGHKIKRGEVHDFQISHSTTRTTNGFSYTPASGHTVNEVHKLKLDGTGSEQITLEAGQMDPVIVIPDSISGYHEFEVNAAKVTGADFGCSASGEAFYIKLKNSQNTASMLRLLVGSLVTVEYATSQTGTTWSNFGSVQSATVGSLGQINFFEDLTIEQKVGAPKNNTKDIGFVMLSLRNIEVGQASIVNGRTYRIKSGSGLTTLGAADDNAETEFTATNNGTAGDAKVYEVPSTKRTFADILGVQSFRLKVIDYPNYKYIVESTSTAVALEDVGDRTADNNGSSYGKSGSNFESDKEKRGTGTIRAYGDFNIVVGKKVDSLAEFDMDGSIELSQRTGLLPDGNRGDLSLIMMGGFNSFCESNWDSVYSPTTGMLVEASWRGEFIEGTVGGTGKEPGVIISGANQSREYTVEHGRFCGFENAFNTPTSMDGGRNYGIEFGGGMMLKDLSIDQSITGATKIMEMSLDNKGMEVEARFVGVGHKFEWSPYADVQSLNIGAKIDLEVDQANTFRQKALLATVTVLSGVLVGLQWYLIYIVQKIIGDAEQIIPSDDKDSKGATRDPRTGLSDEDSTANDDREKALNDFLKTTLPAMGDKTNITLWGFSGLFGIGCWAFLAYQARADATEKAALAAATARGDPPATLTLDKFVMTTAFGVARKEGGSSETTTALITTARKELASTEIKLEEAEIKVRNSVQKLNQDEIKLAKSKVDVRKAAYKLDHTRANKSANRSQLRVETAKRRAAKIDVANSKASVEQSKSKVSELTALLTKYK
jgi:type VI secretion system VgrG family protein